MAEYKVVRRFRDEQTKTTHEVSEHEVKEFTVERADEINEKLKDYGTILKRVKEKAAPKKEETKEAKVTTPKKK